MCKGGWPTYIVVVMGAVRTITPQSNTLKVPSSILDSNMPFEQEKLRHSRARLFPELVCSQKCEAYFHVLKTVSRRVSFESPQKWQVLIWAG